MKNGSFNCRYRKKIIVVDHSTLKLLNTLVLLVVGVLMSFPVYVGADPVQAPVLLKQIKWTGTSWFGSPIIHDLGTGEPKLIHSLIIVP